MSFRPSLCEKKYAATRLPEGTDINNIRLVNNQSAGRKRRETNEDWTIVVDASTLIEVPAASDGATIEVDISGGPVSDAVVENGGTVIDTTVEDTPEETSDDTAQGNESTDESTAGNTSNTGGNGATEEDSAGDSSNNDVPADQTSGNTADNTGEGDENITDEESGAEENPAVDPDTGVEIFNPETVQKVAEIRIPNVVFAANDISDDVKAIIGKIFK